MVTVVSGPGVPSGKHGPQKPKSETTPKASFGLPKDYYTKAARAERVRQGHASPFEELQQLMDTVVEPVVGRNGWAWASALVEYCEDHHYDHHDGPEDQAYRWQAFLRIADKKAQKILAALESTSESTAPESANDDGSQRS